jgi:hypothetical protein
MLKRYAITKNVAECYRCYVVMLGANDFYLKNLVLSVHITSKKREFCKKKKI